MCGGVNVEGGTGAPCRAALTPNPYPTLLHLPPPQGLSQAFAELDSDGSGYLDGSELVHALRVMEPGLLDEEVGGGVRHSHSKQLGVAHTMGGKADTAMAVHGFVL